MPAALPPSPLGERFERAVVAALETCRRNQRVSADVSYVARLFGVCAIVLENGGSESEAIASLLQRAVDRRGALAHVARIGAEFGDDVAAIIGGSIDVSGVNAGAEARPFYDRTLASIERLRQHAAGDESADFGASVFLVSAADTLYSARATNDKLLAGRDVFAGRKGKKFGTLWAYRALADAYLACDGRHTRFAGALIELVDNMAGKPVTTPELLAVFAIDDTVDRREKGSLLEGATR